MNVILLVLWWVFVALIVLDCYCFWCVKVYSTSLEKLTVFNLLELLVSFFDQVEEILKLYFLHCC